MEAKQQRREAPGRFLPRRERWCPVISGRWLHIGVLLILDGVLLYMMVRCLIHPVYGAAFVGIVSIYLGHQL